MTWTAKNSTPLKARENKAPRLSPGASDGRFSLDAGMSLRIDAATVYGCFGFAGLHKPPAGYYHSLILSGMCVTAPGSSRLHLSENLLEYGDRLKRSEPFCNSKKQRITLILRGLVPRGCSEAVSSQIMTSRSDSISSSNPDWRAKVCAKTAGRTNRKASR